MQNISYITDFFFSESNINTHISCPRKFNLLIYLFGGSCLLMFNVSNSSCSVENKVGLLGGVNFEDLSMIYHENHMCRWISSFRYGLC